MPRKNQVEDNSSSQVAVQAVQAVERSERKKDRKPKASVASATNTAPSVVTNTVASATSVASVATVPETTNTTEKHTRRVHTVESVDSEFDSLIRLIDDEINRLKESTQKTKGVRFLKSTRKRLTVIREHNKRVSRRKQTEKRKNNNSGFLKPVQVSRELSDFVGWDHSQLHSRVEATKALCQYISKNNLQDQSNKRIIVPDDRLRKVLSYSDNEANPLTYYNMQKYMTRHFPPSLSKRRAEGLVSATSQPAQAPVQAPSQPVQAPSSQQPKKNRK